jgi:hypothetical protein
MHEQSETIQNAKGKWINVYGRNLPKAGQQLPGTKEHDTVEAAVEEAKARSKAADDGEGEDSILSKLLKMFGGKK